MGNKIPRRLRDFLPLNLRHGFPHLLLPVLLCAALLPLAAGVCWGAPQASGQELQRYTVLSSTHLEGPSQAMTGAEANCVISGSGDDATMKCRPIGITVKNNFHYYAALVVDAQGVAYIVACRNALVTNLWCKPMGNVRFLRGSLADGHLLVSDGNSEKPHDYLVLASRSVGELTATQPAPTAPPAKGKKGRAAKASAPAAPAASVPAASAAPAAPAPAATANRAAENQAKPASASAEGLSSCASSDGACVAFVSEPLGADIYVDGKFVGNTPSTLTLAVGSHEIRMESAGRKPWTRTLETSAGGRITIRGALDAQ